MPTRDSGEQQHRSRTEGTEEVEESAAPSSDLSARKEALDADIDAILDDIDEALETNAEEFVRGFVQKGGQ
ncbi:MAG: ubiquitin-like protein Pup [Frankiales bacterium]|nr:ubiquitin-like protein Pup [Frankiales bacterium]